jgi:hypothetical protein
MTCDGYVDGEWYGHQGVQVLAWPALERCVPLDAEACNELRAVFHMLGEQTKEFAATSQRAFQAIAGDFAGVTLDQPKFWPFPTGKAPEKQPEPEKPSPELLAKIDAWVARQPSKEPEPEKVMPPPLVFAMEYEQPKAPEVRFSTHVHISGGPVDAARLEKIKGALRSCCDEGWRPHSASAPQPSEPQVRSRSAADKSPLNGVLTEQTGRYCGLGFNGEE